MKYLQSCLLVLLLVVPFVFAASPEDAKEAYLNATVQVEQMKRAGLPYESLVDLLAQMEVALKGKNAAKLLETALILNQTGEGKDRAQVYFSELESARSQGLQPGQNFSQVVDIAQVIAHKREQAFELREQIDFVQEEITNASDLNSSQVHALFAQAKDAFESEQYELVPMLLHQTSVKLEDEKVAAARERALARLARRSLQGLVEDHWFTVLVVLFVLVLASLWVFVEVRVFYAEKKALALERDIVSAHESLLQAQKDYYAGEIGRSTYNARIGAIREKKNNAGAQLSAWRELRKKYARLTIVSRFRIK